LKNIAYQIILASASPRRSFLLNEIGFMHTVQKFDFDESVPSEISPELSSLYIAESKSEQIKKKLKHTLYICADTIVLVDGKILGKPKNNQEAFAMLSSLSDKWHQVITGVVIASDEKQVSFHDVSEVKFKELSDSEIDFYIEKYQPIDKAGSYGIQEWIGMIGIESIKGSYFNIMGLPTHRVYEELMKF
jgi:septum formation protein